jgi:hypothetical protein
MSSNTEDDQKGPGFAANSLEAEFAFHPESRSILKHVDWDTVRSDRAEGRINEIELIRTRLASSVDAHVRLAAGALLKAGNNPLSDADYKQFRGRVNHVAVNARLDAELRSLSAEYRSQQTRVVKEPGPYDAGSPSSWIQDCFAAVDEGGILGSRVATGHEERLRRHGEDVAHALRERNAYGKSIERSYLAQHRQDDRILSDQRIATGRQELRALASGGGATFSASGAGAAAFIPPAILMDQWASYRSPHTSFVDQLNHDVALPSWGLTAYIPAWTTGTTVATHTEAASVAEGDPVSGYVSGAVVEKAGQITISQVYLDRAGPGIEGDIIAWQQLKEQLGAQVDAYAITQAIAGAQTVSNSGSFALTSASGAGGLLGDLRKAKNLTRDTAGVRIQSTHCFATGDLVDYITAYADAQGRPIFEPTFDDNLLPIRAGGDPDGEGYSGYVVSGLAPFADDSIPSVSTVNLQQIIVTRPSTILLLESAPISYLMPQGAAANLEAILGVREYVACIARYASGVAVVSGAAYAAATFA